MKRHALAIVAAIALSIGAAGAQATDRGASAQKIFNWCLKLDTGSPSECGCVAGFYAAATEEDEFDLFAEIITFLDQDGQVADPEGLRTALFAEKAAQAMSDARFDEIMVNFAAFDELGVEADAVCLPVERAAGNEQTAQ